MNPGLEDAMPPLYRLRHHHSPCHQLIKIRLKLVLDWYEGNEDDHFLQVFRLRWSRLGTRIPNNMDVFILKPIRFLCLFHSPIISFIIGHWIARFDSFVMLLRIRETQGSDRRLSWLGRDGGRDEDRNREEKWRRSLVFEAFVENRHIGRHIEWWTKRQIFLVVLVSMIQ